METPKIKKAKERGELYKEIIKAVMSVLKKYDIKDIRWALNKWASQEAKKAKLKREIEEKKKELSTIK